MSSLIQQRAIEFGTGQSSDSQREAAIAYDSTGQQTPHALPGVAGANRVLT